MSQKPTIPKGTRDFGPDKMGKRNFIFNAIKSVFEKYSFMPLETPTMENLSVLTGKYGDEGDQLVFKVLNSGDFLSKTSDEDLSKGHKGLLPKIAEKGLRYDLTVPFARHVVMNQNEIAFPFKRYQIQPVWRADRPQRGRYREFYQCDADVVGTKSLLCEAEIILMINEVFTQLNITDYDIKINHRQILTGIVEQIGATGKASDFFVVIDKLDKIGLEKVLEELRTKGFEESALSQLSPILSQKGTVTENIDFLRELFNTNETGKKGVEEIQSVLDYLTQFELENNHIDLDFTLARGLSYYTGAIFEVKVNNVSIGSVSGGGRYDDLTGVFGLKDVSGVGFSFGVDRIYDVMEELSLFPEGSTQYTEAMIVNFGEDSLSHHIKLLAALRKAGVKSELYPDDTKLKKQMNYANKKNIPFVIMMGSDEIEAGKFLLKNMADGTQEALSSSDIVKQIHSSSL
jgi:histidyl-tRNA synthetase